METAGDQKGTATFTCNSEGYLTQFFETQGSNTITITYSYQNSNLVRLDHILKIGGSLPVTATVLFEYSEMLAVNSLPQGILLSDPETTRPVLSSSFWKALQKHGKKRNRKDQPYARCNKNTYLYKE